jgi:hypothetical protein
MGQPSRAELEYDGNADFAGSLEVAYAAIRERMAAGGPGWVPDASQKDCLARRDNSESDT